MKKYINSKIHDGCIRLAGSEERLGVLPDEIINKLEEDVAAAYCTVILLVIVAVLCTAIILW